MLPVMWRGVHITAHKESLDPRSYRSIALMDTPVDCSNHMSRRCIKWMGRQEFCGTCCARGNRSSCSAPEKARTAPYLRAVARSCRPLVAAAFEGIASTIAGGSSRGCAVGARNHVARGRSIGSRVYSPKVQVVFRVTASTPQPNTLHL